MKLVRYGEKGAEKPGLIDKSGQLRDLSAHVKDLDGAAYAPDSLKKLAAIDPASLPAVSGKPRFGAPVTGISKFVAIGLNYVDHAKETGSPIPTEPIFFIKANTALSGPNDAVEKPRGSTKLDWEVEIAAIIGTRAKYVSEADALNHVAGYCCCNDVSERNSRSSGSASGPRASRTTPSARLARGLRPRTKFLMCRSCRCGSTSTASAGRPARPRP
jgi:2-keto-4-pentenoate hydratase/2-oxohepta-3-ene-1,7-dioic acid hydratase in catechol pathway